MLVIRRLPVVVSNVYRLSFYSLRLKSNDFTSSSNFDKKNSKNIKNDLKSSHEKIDSQSKKKVRTQMILDTESSEVQNLTRKLAEVLSPPNASNEQQNIEQELLDVLRGHHVVSKMARRFDKKISTKNESKLPDPKETIQKSSDAFSSLLRDIKLQTSRSSDDSKIQSNESFIDRRTDMRRTDRDNRRRQEYFRPHELWSGQALGIFSKEDRTGSLLEPSKHLSPLWMKADEDELKRLTTMPPRNAFEEMIQWTKDGILWKFPIDNEQDIGPEADVPFYDHVLLERHLQDFPPNPLIRQFMELVCVGLGRNPYWTAEQKLEHIQWFRSFFNEKLNVFNETVHTGTIKSATPTATKPVSTYKPKPPPSPPKVAPVVTPAVNKK